MNKHTISGRDSWRDEGIAVPAVIGIVAVVMAFLLIILSTVLRTQTQARAEQDTDAALAAAQAGIADFQNRLELFDGTDIDVLVSDATNPALDADPGTPECEGSGAPVMAHDSVSSRYCYRVVPPAAAGAPITVHVTGFAGVTNDTEESKRLVAHFGNGGVDSFTKYIQFNDFETVDPWRWGLPSDVASACQEYQWSGLRPDVCTNPVLPFRGDSTYDGDIHSNDRITIGNDIVVNSDWVVTGAQEPLPDGSLSAGPGSFVGATLRSGPVVGFPTALTGMIEHSLPKIDASANTNRPGCLYRGLTKISVSGGNVSVESPGTDTVGPNCPPANGSLWPTPPLIYVAVGTTGCATTAFANMPYPQEKNEGFSSIDWSGCRGTAVVTSNASTRPFSVGTDDDIVINGDVRIASTGWTDPDLKIGLAAGNSVIIRNPLDVGGNPLEWFGDRTVDAAILAARGTMVAQNFDFGMKRSGFVVNGSVTQKHSGPVGYLTHGFFKDYSYDARLYSSPPPYFPTPANSQFALLDVALEE